MLKNHIDEFALYLDIFDSGQKFDASPEFCEEKKLGFSLKRHEKLPTASKQLMDAFKLK